MRGLRGGKTEECRGDLLAREHRGALSGTDVLALRAHLAQCASCRAEREVFVDLDDVSGVDLYDGARIAKMSTMARRWGEQRSRPRTPVWSRLWASRAPIRTLTFAAVVLLVGGSASATVWWFRHPHAPLAAKPGTSEPVDRSVPTVRRKPAERGPAAPAVEPQPAAVTAPRQRAHAARMDTAAALLRQASEARRAGDAERAIGLYRRLQRNHPRSAEATLSAVSLGGLLLDERLPHAALTQFDAYLAASKGGALIPEALYGRGRALAALGDRAEERRSWERLLADFPESAYGPFARRRMQELR